MSTEYKFKCDNTQLLSLIVNNFHSNKYVFLRELISNASDALDKMKYKSIVNKEILREDDVLHIQIVPNKKNKTLTIIDTGIGMTRQELITNMGTLGRRSNYFGQLMNCENGMSLIGNFGIGFYTAFLVSYKLSVISKSDDDEAHLWESDGKDTFTVSKLEDCQIKRGTHVTCHLKSDQFEYLDENRIREIIMKNSQFITHNIDLAVDRSFDTLVTDSDESTITRQVHQTIKVMETLNRTKPLWIRNPTEITHEEYTNFYRCISSDLQHLAVKHFTIEQALEFSAILYVPRRAPFDVFNPKKRNNIKLYVQRVLVLDTCELFPEWLQFITGVVDSDDLPLTISRQNIHQNKILKVIRKILVRKSIEMFREISENEDDYMWFYNQYSKYIKLGIHEDFANRSKLADLVRYYSSTSGDDLVSLKDYVTRMKEGQDEIYYITGESKENLLNSPFLEQCNKRYHEVLLMIEPIDEYVMLQLKEFDGKNFCCLTDEFMKLKEKELIDEDDESIYSTLCTTIKDILGDKINAVVTSDRLTTAPGVIVTSKNQPSTWTGQIVKKDSPMQDMLPLRTMQINPKHEIIKALHMKVKSGTEFELLREMIMLLFEAIMLNCGFKLDNPSGFTDSIHKLISFRLSNNYRDDNEYVIVDPPAQDSTTSSGQ